VTERLVAGCAGLAAVALGLGYGLAGRWAGIPAVAALLLLWLVGRQRWRWTATMGLVSFSGAAAAGVLLGLDAAWMVTGLVAALCTWDLDHFARRLQGVDWADGNGERTALRRELERSHLGWLLAVAGLGLLLAALALRVRVRLAFLTAVLLGLLAVLGLSRAIAFLRGEPSGELSGELSGEPSGEPRGESN
jgi:hypothetical protein